MTKSPDKASGTYLPRTAQEIVQRALDHAIRDNLYDHDKRAIANTYCNALRDGTLHLLETTTPRPMRVRWLYGRHDPMGNFPATIPDTRVCASWSDAVEALLDEMAMTVSGVDVVKLGAHRRQAYEQLKEDQSGWFAYAGQVWWVKALVTDDA